MRKDVRREEMSKFAALSGCISIMLKSVLLSLYICIKFSLVTYMQEM